MRKYISVLLIFTLILSSAAPSFAITRGYLGEIVKEIDAEKIKEGIKEVVEIGQIIIDKIIDIANHWAKEYIEKLISSGGINGYPDGTFKPDNTIKVGEFTKILISSLGYDGIENYADGHWSLNFVDKAKELGIILEGEFTDRDLDRNITRAEMARMIVRALDEDPSNLEEYKTLIKDYDTIPKDYQEYVLKAYSKGIITGYPDGTFKYDTSATRAEASTMIVRLFDESERKVPEVKETTEEPTEIIINGETVVSENPNENVIPIAIKAREIMKEGKGLLYEQYAGKEYGDILYWYYADPNVNVDDFDERYTMDMDFVIYTENRSKDGTEYPYKIGLTNANVGKESFKFSEEIFKLLFPNSYEEAYSVLIDVTDKKRNNINFELKDKKYKFDNRILRIQTLKGNELINFTISVKGLEE